MSDLKLPDWFISDIPSRRMDRLITELENLTNLGRDIAAGIKACNDLQYQMRAWLREVNPQSMEDDEMAPDAIQEMATVLQFVVFDRLETVKRMMLAAGRDLRDGSGGAHGADQGGDAAVVGKEEGNE